MPLHQVWAALRDWGALHERLAPGFVANTHIDGNDRIVTFADGAICAGPAHDTQPHR